MLYDRWRDVAREFRDELALLDVPSGRRWTFRELETCSVDDLDPGPVAFASGNTPEFIFNVLRAWRAGQVLCPIENGQRAPDFPLPPKQVVHVKVTSATSGPPKFVAFTAAQLAADAANIVRTMGLRRDWPNLAFISLAHSYGFSNLVTPLLLHGIPLLLGGVPLPEMVRAAAEHAPEITLPAVPALWRAWHDAGAIPPNVRLAISAGAPLPLPLEAGVHSRSGIKIHNFYGASECGGIAYDRTGSPRADASLAGTSMENVHLALGAERCLEVRGNNVAESYWPEADETLRNGCYRTSDVAEIRAGAVFLRGRATDVINVAGRKVSPESIEVLLQQHAAVRECLVFGTPADDRGRGDTIVACVVAAEGTTVESLRRFLLERTGAWQVPREFWFVESLAANQRGKLSRAEWKQRYLQRTK